MSRTYADTIPDDEVATLVQRFGDSGFASLGHASARGAYKSAHFHPALARHARTALRRFATTSEGDVDQERFAAALQTLLETGLPHTDSFHVLRFLALAEHHSLRFHSVDDAVLAIMGLHELLAEEEVSKKSKRRGVFYRRVQTAFMFFGGHHECIPEIAEGVTASALLNAMAFLSAVHPPRCGCQYLRAAQLLEQHDVPLEHFVELLVLTTTDRLDDFTALVATGRLTRGNIETLVENAQTVNRLTYVELYKLLNYWSEGDPSTTFDGFARDFLRDVERDPEPPEDAFASLAPSVEEPPPAEDEGDSSEPSNHNHPEWDFRELELPADAFGDRVNTDVVKCVLVEVILQPGAAQNVIFTGSRIQLSDFHARCETALRAGKLYNTEHLKVALEELAAMSVLETRKPRGGRRSKEGRTTVRFDPHPVSSAGKQLTNNLRRFRRECVHHPSIA